MAAVSIPTLIRVAIHPHYREDQTYRNQIVLSTLY